MDFLLLPSFVKASSKLLIAFEVCTSTPPAHWVKANPGRSFVGSALGQLFGLVDMIRSLVQRAGGRYVCSW